MSRKQRRTGGVHHLVGKRALENPASGCGARSNLMAETLDFQLKQMSEDLKEVVEHLNEAKKYQIQMIQWSRSGKY